MKTTKARWKEGASIHLSQKKKKHKTRQLKLIFASINRKDESVLLKHWGRRSVPPCISNRGHRSAAGIPLRSCSSVLRLAK